MQRLLDVCRVVLWIPTLAKYEPTHREMIDEDLLSIIPIIKLNYYDP